MSTYFTRALPCLCHAIVLCIVRSQRKLLCHYCCFAINLLRWAPVTCCCVSRHLTMWFLAAVCSRRLSHHFGKTNACSYVAHSALLHHIMSEQRSCSCSAIISFVSHVPLRCQVVTQAFVTSQLIYYRVIIVSRCPIISFSASWNCAFVLPRVSVLDSRMNLAHHSYSPEYCCLSDNKFFICRALICSCCTSVTYLRLYFAYCLFDFFCTRSLWVAVFLWQLRVSCRDEPPRNKDALPRNLLTRHGLLYVINYCLATCALGLGVHLLFYAYLLSP